MSALAPELLLAALVVTSLATGGLLGLWAATSPQHWFVRTLAVFAALTPLLYRPIYEPFVTLLVEVGVVVLGVTIWRRNWPQFRFSIAGLMMLTVPVAILVAAAMRAPEYGVTMQLNWGQAAFLSQAASLATLLAAWLVVHRNRSPWRWFVVLIGLPTIVSVWAASNYVDQIVVYGFDSLLTLGLSEDVRIYLVAAIEALFLIGIVSAFVVAARNLKADSDKFRVKLAIALAVVALTALPVYFAYRLSTPLPIPEQTPLAENGYDRLLELGEWFKWSRLAKAYHAEPQDDIKLRLEAGKKEPTDKFAELERVMSGPIALPPVDYNDAFSTLIDDNSLRRQLLYMLSAKSAAAEVRRDWETSFETQLQRLKLCQQLSCGGLLNDALLTAAGESDGAERLWKLKLRLSSDRLVSAAESLLVLDATRESFEAVAHREQTYSENYMGWLGHLMEIFYDNFDIKLGDMRISGNGYRWGVSTKGQAKTRLIATEFALHAYQLENNTYPESLADLVPNYLPHVPADPCSESDEPLIYRRTPEGYQLYSRGYDGDDDDGKPCRTANEWGTIDWTTDGDLSLEAYFAEE